MATSLVHFLKGLKLEVKLLRRSSKDEMLRAGRPQNHKRAGPTNVCINMWQHSALFHFSTVAAPEKTFRWSSGSSVPSYVFTLAGIFILLGKSKCAMCSAKHSSDLGRYGSEGIAPVRVSTVEAWI